MYQERAASRAPRKCRPVLGLKSQNMFLQAKKAQKTYILFFASLKTLKKAILLTVNFSKGNLR